jgi:DHA1 family inner membrane transport protein
MAFLRNGAINRVNLHSAVQALAQGAGGVFVLIYLLRAGLSVPAALLAQAAIVAGRFLLRPLALPFAHRWGLKPLVIAGALLMAAPFPLLAEIRGVGPRLLALCLVSSMGEVLYWMAYNAWFAALGDPEHRGSQIGAREALVAAAGVVGLLVGTWALVSLGPRPAFAAIALVQAAAVLPLLGAPNVSIHTGAPGDLAAARPALLLIAADGWFDATFFFVWQIALFVSLGRSVAAYGGAMVLAGLAGAVAAPLVGRHIDAGNGRTAALLVYVLAAAIVVARALSLGAPWLAVAANALGALLMPLLSPSMGAVTYDLARAAPCPLRFYMVTDAGWDLGCCSACLAAAALAACGAPLSIAILLGLPAAATGAAALRRLYPDRAGPSSAAS